METLGLTEDELCRVLDTDALSLLSGQLEQPLPLRILSTLLDDALERTSAATLRAWLRTPGPHGVPLDALTRRDFATFEDALEALGSTGFVIRTHRPDGGVRPN
jgi:hypothetical protein